MRGGKEEKEQRHKDREMEGGVGAAQFKGGAEEQKENEGRQERVDSWVEEEKQEWRGRGRRKTINYRTRRN